MDLTEAEDIKKRWQEYTEELYKKDPNNLDNHNGVITHLEPDILECEVKWEALSGGGDRPGLWLGGRRRAHLGPGPRAQAPQPLPPPPLEYPP